MTAQTQDYNESSSSRSRNLRRSPVSVREEENNEYEKKRSMSSDGGYRHSHRHHAHRHDSRERKNRSSDRPFPPSRSVSASSDPRCLPSRSVSTSSDRRCLPSRSVSTSSDRRCPSRSASSSSSSGDRRLPSRSASSSSSSGDRRLPSRSFSTSHSRLSFRSRDFILQRSKNISQYYKMGDLLGEGGFGACYTAHKLATGAERAVKILPRGTPEEEKEVYNEFSILSRCDHPNVAKVYEMYKDKDFFYIVTDLYKGGDLFSIVEKGQLKEYDTAQVITSLLQAVSYMHNRNLCHRDLKPENILLDHGSSWGGIRVIDFGFSRYQDNDKHDILTDDVGSLDYVAPQVLQKHYTKACDVWSVGVIAFVLLAGRAPFEGENDSEVAKAILIGKFDMHERFWKDISKECKDFIKLLLSYEEADRPTAEQALTHPWLATMRAKHLKENAVKIQGELREALGALERFRSHNCKFKQAVSAVLAAQFFTNKDRDIIDPMFRAFDCSSGTADPGRLSVEDLHSAYWLTDFMGEERSDAQMENIIREVSFSRSKQISYSEFSAVMMLETGLMDSKRFLDVFDYFDMSRNAEIDWRDLEHFLFASQKKNRSTEDQCRGIIAEATNGGKRISFHDFKRIMLSNDYGCQTIDTA